MEMTPQELIQKLEKRIQGLEKKIEGLETRIKYLESNSGGWKPPK